MEDKNYHFETLESGLRTIIVPMAGTKTVTVLVLVGTGSKYETKNINGISHFLEHMMFKGTVKRPGNLDIARELDTLGAEYNAFTSKEYTGYYARAENKKFDVVLDVISDIFLNSKLDEADINMEKGVIIEEINMTKDNPMRYIGTLFDRLLYGDQPAGWEIAGEKEIVSALRRDDFVNYFNTHYIAQNTVVAVAGNVGSIEARDKIKKCFENIRQGKTVTKLAVKEEQTKPEALITWKETDQAHFHLGFRSYNMFDDRKYPLSILASVLGGGMSSRLFQEVRVKRGLAYYVGAGTESLTDTGVFEVNAGVDKSRALDAVKVILEEINKIKEGGATDKEIQQAKDHVTGGLALYLENSSNVAMSYSDPVLFENKVLTPEEELIKLNRVTADEISAVAKEIFSESKLNFAIIGPFKEKEDFEQILKL